jgi:hypothetical protein
MWTNFEIGEGEVVHQPFILMKVRFEGNFEYRIGIDKSGRPAIGIFSF